MNQPKSWADLTTAPEHKIAVLTVMKDISRGSEGTTILFRASTPVVDRDREQLMPIGWKWRTPLPNQLYGHDPKVSENFIGKGNRVWKDEEALWYETVLFDKSPSSKGDLARHIAWIAETYPEALTSSVSFAPLKWQDPDGRTFTIDAPGNSRPWSTPGRKYLEQELLENSIAPVASNFEALAVQVRSLIKRGGVFIPDNDIAPTPPALEPMAQMKALADSLGIPLEIVENDPAWAALGVKHPVSRPIAKVGAVLSRANLDRLQQIASLATEVIASATPAEPSMEGQQQ